MQIVKKLGDGAFANVYLATYNNKHVALKIPKNNISKKKTYAFSINEVQILNNFKNSTYIVNLIHYDISNTKNNIIIELLGGELYTVLKLFKTNKQQLSLAVVKRFAKQILCGLVEMAQCNILHNDLKPENILFTKSLGILFTHTKEHNIKLILQNAHTSNIYLKQHIVKFYNVLHELILLTTHVKINDFGNAYSIDSVKTDAEGFVHARPTRHYVSPEILIKNTFWLPSDMWSFGCIVYEMLTNTLLFNPTRTNNMGVNSAHLASIIETLGEFNDVVLQNATKRNRYFYNTTHKFNYLIKKNNTLSDLLYYYNLSNNEYDFLKPIFIYNTTERITPVDCLNTKWLKNIL